MVFLGSAVKNLGSFEKQGRQTSQQLEMWGSEDMGMF